jgi:hypothetical protein
VDIRHADDMAMASPQIRLKMKSSTEAVEWRNAVAWTDARSAAAGEGDA